MDESVLTDDDIDDDDEYEDAETGETDDELTPDSITNSENGGDDNDNDDNDNNDDEDMDEDDDTETVHGANVDDDDKVLIFGEFGNKKNKRKLNSIKEEKDGVVDSGQNEGNVDEFDDNLCMGFEIEKTAKRNEAFNRMKYRVLMNKIGIEALVVSNVDVDDEVVQKSIPVIKNSKGIFVPKYEVKGNRSFVSNVIKLMDFAEVSMRTRIGNQGHYFVFKKDEKLGVYRFVKVELNSENQEFYLDKGDRYLQVDASIFGLNYGGFIDKKGNIHINFFSENYTIPTGDVWEYVKKGCCYITNKIFSLFKKKKDIENDLDLYKSYINEKKIINIKL